MVISTIHNWSNFSGKAICQCMSRAWKLFLLFDPIFPYLGTYAKEIVRNVKYLCINMFIFSSVQFSCSVVSDSLQPHELQHAGPPCPSPAPGVYSNSCPSSRWCHPAISSSVVPVSSCPQSLPASGSFPMSQLVAWGGQSTGVSASASVLPMNTQRKSLKCSTWMQSQKWQNDLCSFLRETIQYHGNPSLCPKQ